MMDPIFDYTRRSNIKNEAQSEAQENPAKPRQYQPAKPSAIIIDTREQLPYAFSRHIPTRREKLEVGDYSLAGLGDYVALERKTLEDYIHSLTHERTRFFTEIAALARLHHKAIIVEAGWNDIIRSAWERDVTAESIIGSTVTIDEVYKVPVRFLVNRQAAIVYAEAWLMRVGRIAVARRWGLEAASPVFSGD